LFAKGQWWCESCKVVGALGNVRRRIDRSTNFIFVALTPLLHDCQLTPPLSIALHRRRLGMIAEFVTLTPPLHDC
jgi:hypothetical protein